MVAKGFRKIDNELFTALIAAKLSGSVYQILLTIIDQTIGFRRDKAAISLSKFQHRTGLSRQGVVDAIQYAEKRKIIRSEKGKGKATIYTVNTDWVVKSTLLDQSSLLDQTSQVVETSTTMLKETIKETIKEKNDPFDAEWVALFEQIIDYYFKVYRKHRGKPHPALKAEQWQRVVVELESFADEKAASDLKDWQSMIDYHFHRELKTDWNINHFATPGILENLLYKSGLY